MSLSVYTYVKREKIQFYEVVDGGIVNDKDYTGLIIRDEEVKYTDRAGTIDYYVREGRRAAVGTTVYSIDEENKMAGYLAEHNKIRPGAESGKYFCPEKAAVFV